MPVNGSDHDSIAWNDRGLAYDDGVFETIRLHNNKALLMESHLDRLALGSQQKIAHWKDFVLLRKYFFVIVFLIFGPY
jgi:4-amino-4-deoxychorismate lyase